MPSIAFKCLLTMMNQLHLSDLEINKNRRGNEVILYIFCEFPFKNARFPNIRYNITYNYSGYHIKNNEVGGRVARMGDRRGTCRVLVEKPEGKGPFGRPGRR
jgi:hypothetical protein